MTRRCLVAFSLAAFAGPGCFSARPSAPDNFLCLAIRNAVERPIQHHDDKRFTKTVRRRAEAAYTEVCKAGRHKPCDAYRDGFVEGFIDYVEAGGNGEPPYLPPFRFRLTAYRTASGHAIVDEWYTGFRHGASAASESGLRELNFVPLPGPPIPADPPSSLQRTAVLPQQAPSTVSPWDLPGSTPTIPMSPLPKADPIPPAKPEPLGIPSIVPQPLPPKPAGFVQPNAGIVPAPASSPDARQWSGMKADAVVVQWRPAAPANAPRAN